MSDPQPIGALPCVADYRPKPKPKPLSPARRQGQIPAHRALRGGPMLKARRRASPDTVYEQTQPSAQGPLDPLQPLIARLTNWQRRQWAKAGYPKSATRLAAFLTLQRP